MADIFSGMAPLGGDVSSMRMLMPSLGVEDLKKSMQESALKAQAEEKKKAAAISEEKKMLAEAGKFTELGAMSKDQEAYMQQLKGRSEGKDLISATLAERAQEKTSREMMAAAYARGYDPGAQRAALRQASEAQTDIATQAMAAGAQEKAQAMAAYGQMLQYKQQMAFSAEEARKAYIMGNKELAQQLTIETKRIKAGLQGAQMQAQAMQNQAAAQERAAWIGAGATVLAGGLSTFAK